MAQTKTPKTPKTAAAPKGKVSKKPEPEPEPVVTATAKLEKISKAELVDLIAQKASLSKKRADDAFSAALEVIVDTLKSGGKIGLPGFGTLEVRETKARGGVRPGTTERIEIPAGKKVAFKLASDLKADLNA